MISLEILFKLPKNGRMLYPEDIAQLDKLQRPCVIYLGSAPIHNNSFLAIWCLDRLDSASLKKVYQEDSKKLNGVVI
jgi:hypothetical protein